MSGEQVRLQVLPKLYTVCSWILRKSSTDSSLSLRRYTPACHWHLPVIDTCLSLCRYLDVAKATGVGCRCFVIAVTHEHAKHNERVKPTVGKTHSSFYNFLFFFIFTCVSVTKKNPQCSTRNFVNSLISCICQVSLFIIYYKKWFNWC